MRQRIASKASVLAYAMCKQATLFTANHVNVSAYESRITHRLESTIEYKLMVGFQQFLAKAVSLPLHVLNMHNPCDMEHRQTISFLG